MNPRRITAADAIKVEEFVAFMLDKKLLGFAEAERIRHRLRLARAWQTMTVRQPKHPTTHDILARLPA